MNEPIGENRARILYLDHAPILGGAEIVLLNLLKMLDSNRFAPMVATSAHSPLLAVLEQHGIETFTLPFGRLNEAGAAMPVHLARTVFALTRLLRQRNIALLHTNTVRAHIVGSLAGALCRVPVIWTWHDNTLPITWARRLARFPSRVITVSAWLRDWYAPAGCAPKTVVIPNGVSLTVFCDSQNLRAELGIPPDAPLVVNVGRLVERKAPHLFVQAAQRVLQVLPNAYFVLVGGPDRLEPGQRVSPYLEELERAVRVSNLGDHLRMVGPREDVARFFAATDLVIQCAIQPEGFGMVLIEAMAARKPIVASRIGAAPEIVQDGITGLLVPPGDVDALASAMLSILQDKERKQAMGLAGRDKVEKEFDLRMQVRNIEQVYEQVL